MSILQAIIIGFIQGATELFPISSLGHSVIIPKLLGWNIHQNDPFFLTFLVATHLATAVVLFIFFWRDWLAIIHGVVRSFAAREIKPADTYAKFGWLLIVGTVPAGLIGLLFEEPLRSLFASARIAAAFLIVNGLILLGAERLRKNAGGRRQMRQNDAAIAKLSWSQAIGIGAAQAGALLPGISRSGTSMAGSLLAGLSNENAARFSFLLATPVIGAAALLKLPELFQPSTRPLLGAIAAGSVCAAVMAYISVKFLIKYFETKTLLPFGIYCLIAGALFSIILAVR